MPGARKGSNDRHPVDSRNERPAVAASGPERR